MENYVGEDVVMEVEMPDSSDKDEDNLSENKPEDFSVVDRLLSTQDDSHENVNKAELPSDIELLLMEEGVWEQYHSAVEGLSKYLATSSGNAASEDYQQLEGLEVALQRVLLDASKLLASIDLFKSAAYDMAEHIARTVATSYQPYLDEDGE